jgi:hypothetical protein
MKKNYYRVLLKIEYDVETLVELDSPPNDNIYSEDMHTALDKVLDEVLVRCQVEHGNRMMLCNRFIERKRYDTE